MKKKSITQLYLFRFTQNRFWAFKQMGIAGPDLHELPGLHFFKLLGTGGGNGFSLWPDFSTYALLLVWENEAMANNFQNHPLFSAYNEKAQGIRKLSLENFQSHGKWSGSNPFESTAASPQKEQAVAIITRATLRWNRLLSFWKNVPKASRAIENAKGVYFFKGIGEWPFLQQATISLWNSLDDVMHYAYKEKAHKEIVKKTRTKHWYAEDLFARFIIIEDQKLL